MPREWGCIRMLCIRIQFYLSYWLRCAVCFVLTWWGVADESVYRISYPCICFWMWQFTADVARCNNNALSELVQRNTAGDSLVYADFGLCSWTMSFVVRFALDFRWKESNSGRTELDLGLVCSMQRFYNSKCVASCSINRFLFCFDRAVGVRIVIYLSVLERWRTSSRLIVMTLGDATFGLILFCFRVKRFWFECDVAWCCYVCWGEVFVLISMDDINLVDPASSHTLVSKIKPCMSKYKHFCTVKLRMAHYISYSLLDSTLLLG